MNKEKIIEILQAIEDGKEIEAVCDFEDGTSGGYYGTSGVYITCKDLLHNLDNFRVKVTAERLRQAEIENAWNKKGGKDCNIEIRRLDGGGGEWKGYVHEFTPSWNWEKCDYRVKPDPERQRQIEIEKAWNGEGGEECNIEWELKDLKECQNHLVDRPCWNWEYFDYRVKENPTKQALQEVIKSSQEVIYTLRQVINNL